MDRKHHTNSDADFTDYDDALDWLELTPEERSIVELRLALGRAVRAARQRKPVSQLKLAQRIGSSQSRIAKVEAGAKGVSLDLGFKVLFAAGGSVADLLGVLEPVKAKSKPTGRRGSSR
jgi:DNA-binding XRE family transcriptional regulator